MSGPPRTGWASGRTVALIVLVVVNLILVVLNLQKQELFPFESGHVTVVDTLR